MAVQRRLDVTVRKAKLRGTIRALDSAVFGQDATGDEIVTNTVITKDPATGKWYALTNLALTDGLEVPRGIYIGPGISQTDIQAGDVTGQSVVYGGDSDWDLDLVIFQNSIVLTDEIASKNKTVEDALAQIGLFMQSVDYVSETENA